jgi:stage V sporulation protein AD
MPKKNTKKESKMQTIFFKNKPKILSGYSIVGPKEGNGPFGKMFDYVMKDDFFGEKTYEKAERRMLEQAVFGATDNAMLKPKDIDMLISGDLLNQIITSSYTARAFDVAFLGLFAACSTMTLSLAVGACFVNAGYFKNVACATSSHFSTAERQFRFPLELGNQRPPTAQWTCTAAGCTILSSEGENLPYIDSITLGKVMDYGISDVNNMGAAMAPAAMQTLVSVFKETKTKPADYDLIITGDLGKLGSEILIDLMEREGYKLGVNYSDCGQMMFYYDQKVLMGGSGCGCSASIFNSYVLNKLKAGEFKKVLYIATGALLSTTSTQQGDTIPGIAHAVVIKSDKGQKGEKV